AILIANAYFDLVSQKQQLVIVEQDYEAAVFDSERAKALQELDRDQAQQVFLAQRREIEAEDRMLDARTSLELALDDFRILLGLPTSRAIEIADVEPPFKEIRFDPDSAVRCALANRLDLHTERDRLADAQRQVAIARNGLLPDLDLTASYGNDGAGDRFSSAGPDAWQASVGVRLEIPLDRKAERNQYRSSLIGLARTERRVERRHDEVERDVVNRLRELERTQKQIEIQETQIARERRAVAVEEIRFDAGDVDARDLLEARQGLTDSLNSLIDLRVDHFIARLRLRRDLGIFLVNSKGMWQE
ncbi:MAG: TolC family protein, partial [Phycisphaerales bacterium]|nr:TolC family protein [Phycisphaerales bacterium]